MDQAKTKGFLVGPWRVDPFSYQIESGEKKKRLEPRTMSVLVHLAKHPDMVISREELLSAVWGDCFVSENTLSQTISRLRKALGDDWQQPRYLETISKNGYRLIAPVVPLTGDLPHVQRSTRPDRFTNGTRTWRRFAITLATCLPLLGILAWSLMDAPTEERILLPTVTPAITLVGKQHHAVFSPDGNQIAFAWDGNGTGNFDIYIQTIGAENPLRLTSDPSGEGLPAWSPDGRSLTFLSAEGASCGMFRMPVTGGARERLGDCQPGMRQMRWSPDGKLLVLDGLSEDLKTGAIFLFDPATGQRTQITSPGPKDDGNWSPCFSPDQSHIAFIRRESAQLHHLYLLALDGGEPQRLTQHTSGRIRGVDWAADGKSLVFSCNRDGRFALWRHELASGRESRLAITDEWVTYPSLARERQALIYKNYVDIVDLWAIELGEEGLPNGEPRQVLSSTRSEFVPRLSPDGRHLAFLSTRTGSFELWSGDLSDGSLIRHTNLKGGAMEMLAWSPDGKELVFHRRIAKQLDLFAVPAGGNQAVALTATPWDEANARFGRSTESLYFASTESGAWQIWVMARDGSHKRMLTKDGGFFAQEGPESRYLYFTKLNEGGFYRMLLQGGDAELLWDGLGSMDWGNWQMCTSGLYFIDRQGNRLMHQRFSEPQPRQILKGTKTFPYLGPSFHVAPDETRIYFSQITQSDDEIMLAVFPDAASGD